MTPKQIADHLVEMGILDYIGNHREMSRPGYTEFGRFYWVKGDEKMEDESHDAEQIIQDWRVAGKCLEAMDLQEMIGAYADHLDWLKDPQAICTAYCEATHE